MIIPGPDLPHSEEAEQALLGAVLVDNRVLDRVSDYLRPEHFFYPAHARIFEASLALRDQGRIADTVTLRGRFEQDGDLAEVGGGGYLADLAAGVWSLSGATEHARLLVDLHLRREMIRLADETAADARRDLDRTGADLLRAAEEQLYALGIGAAAGSAAGAGARKPVRMAEALDRVIRATGEARDARARGEPPRTISAGLQDLDRLMGGLWPGQYTIIGARPSMGKTALAQHMAMSAAARGAGVLFASLEMTADQLAERIFQREIGVTTAQMLRGEVRAGTVEHMIQVRQALGDLPLYTLGAGVSIGEIARQARAMRRRHDRVLVIVDYLQLLEPPTRRRESNRNADLTEISAALKRLAVEVGCPVVALSQLSRQVEARPNKRPQLADLRESGSIEQDADVVMFLYREEYYLDRAEPDQADATRIDWEVRREACRHVCELVLAKQRMGPIAVLRVRFDAASGRFDDLSSATRRDDDRMPELI